MNGNEHLWRQFEKLGEMIGDGLHLEEDGKWISSEYNKLAKILCPEGFAEIRKQKSEALTKQFKRKSKLINVRIVKVNSNKVEAVLRLLFVLIARKNINTKNQKNNFQNGKNHF